MTIFCWILVVLLLLVGFLGCFINRFPGPLMAFLAMFIAKVGIGIPFGWWALIVVAILVAASMYVGKVVLPTVTKKFASYTKGANGTTLGSIIGLFLILVGSGSTALLIVFAILGLLVLPFVFAYVFEKGVHKNDNNAALQSAIGATVAYLCTSLVKLLVFVISCYVIFKFS